MPVSNINELAKTAALCKRCRKLFYTASAIRQLAREKPDVQCRFSDLGADCSLCSLLRRTLLAQAPVPAQRSDTNIDVENSSVRLMLWFEEEGSEQGESEEGDASIDIEGLVPSALTCFLFDGDDNQILEWTTRLALYAVPGPVIDLLGLGTENHKRTVPGRWRTLTGFYESDTFWMTSAFREPIFDWVKRCRQSHPLCGQKKLPTLPSLVIDVSECSKYSRVFVRPTSDHLEAEYIALSYCWGGPQKLTTTMANRLSHEKRGIDIVDLPSTIADAIKVTISLGIKFLWVDALCIVQDDNELKAVEIERMGEIYTNATIVLLASGSTKAADDELLSPWKDIAVVKYFVSSSDGTVPICLAPEIQEITALDTRGWTFQERHLATRSLEFGGAKGILATCKESSMVFEHDCWNSRTLPITSVRRDSDAAKMPSVLEEWYVIVQEYAQRQLSFGCDRLPALAGYAKAIAPPDDEYLAGLWKSQIIDDLMWQSRPGRIGPGDLDLSQYRSPGWSWLSVLDIPRPPSEHPSFISYPLQLLKKLGGRGDAMATLIDHSMHLAHPNVPFGEVHGGTLTLQAKVAPLATWSSEVDRARFLGGSDYRLTTEQQHRVHLLLLQSTSRWSFDDSSQVQFGRAGLLLLDCERNGVFQRIGAFWAWSGNINDRDLALWNDLIPTEVILV